MTATDAAIRAASTSASPRSARCRGRTAVRRTRTRRRAVPEPTSGRVRAPARALAGAVLAPQSRMEPSQQRERMVERHIRARGVRDDRVLAAIAEVPREAFVAPELAEFAYDDRPLPIEAGQTISQPYIVAVMAAALRLDGSEDVLEVGTGSGYAAAVLAKLARRVYTIERHAELADLARTRLAGLGPGHAGVRSGGGTVGW